MRRRRGFIGDALTIIISGFSLAIFVAIMVYFVSTINTAFQADASIDADAKSMMQAGNNEYPGAMDVLILSFLLGAPIIAAILAYFLDFSTILFWAMLIVSILYIIVGAVFAWAWDAIINSGDYGTKAASLTGTNYIMNNYALYALYVIVIILAGMFFRMRSGNA